MKFNKTQVAVIVGALLVVVLLLFANTKIPKKEKVEVAEQNATEGSFDQLLEKAVKSFPQMGQDLFSKHRELLKTPKSVTSYDVIVQAWDSLQQPLVAAYFFELKAKTFPGEATWQEAADRYYVLTGYIEAESRKALYEKAMLCYENVLKINPKNIDAKIDLASCYVNAVNPMQGIGMLKEIEKTHPDNVKVQYNLAYFAIQSGQMEKAIERFEKILKMEPDNVNIYANIADVYERMENKEKAVEYYEKFAARTSDLKAKIEIEGHINKLKTN